MTRVLNQIRLAEIKITSDIEENNYAGSKYFEILILIPTDSNRFAFPIWPPTTSFYLSITFDSCDLKHFRVSSFGLRNTYFLTRDFFFFFTVD